MFGVLWQVLLPIKHNQATAPSNHPPLQVMLSMLLLQHNILYLMGDGIIEY